MSAPDPSVSKLISLILRHRPQDFGVALDAHGWIAIDLLLAALARAGTPITRAELDAIVATSDKQRFAIAGDRIRAQQGHSHSVGVELDYAPAAPPETLYHGTVARFRAAARA